MNMNNRCINVARLTTRKRRVPALDATTGPVSSHIVVCNNKHGVY
jgi:hypothetical protein